jgi:hypothetical protein
MQRHRYDTSPVHPEKINLIKNMLNDPIINELWLKFIHLGSIKASYKERERVFQEYCHFRDLYLGLPPLIITPIQGTHRKNWV